jgi:hypothetical protein
MIPASSVEKDGETSNVVPQGPPSSEITLGAARDLDAPAGDREASRRKAPGALGETLRFVPDAGTSAEG